MSYFLRLLSRIHHECKGYCYRTHILLPQNLPEAHTLFSQNTQITFLGTFKLKKHPKIRRYIKLLRSRNLTVSFLSIPRSYIIDHYFHRTRLYCSELAGIFFFGQFKFTLYLLITFHEFAGYFFLDLMQSLQISFRKHIGYWDLPRNYRLLSQIFNIAFGKVPESSLDVL